MATIRKRSWRTASGEQRERWQVDFRDQSGGRVHKQFDRKKDADAWLVAARGQVQGGSFVADRASITVEGAVDLWLEVCEHIGRRGREPVEPHTLRVYRTHGEHIKGMVGKIRLNQLTGPMCIGFRDELLKRFTRRNAAKVLTSFKSVLREMRARGRMVTTPADDVSIVVSARLRDRLAVASEDQAGEIPSPEQMARVFAAADQVLSPRDRALVYTIPFTGMRLSEARGFPWPNHDPKARTMSVTQRADELGKIDPPKTAAGWRTIHVPVELVEILKAWRKVCRIWPSKLMFPNGKGNAESGGNLHNRVWKPVMTKAGLVDRDGNPLFDMKSLRHFYASYRIAQGANPKQIQVEMGHSNVVVTLQIYGHLFPDETGERPARAASMGTDLMSRRDATRMQHDGAKLAEIRHS